MPTKLPILGKRTGLCVTALTAAFLSSPQVFSAGFQISEQSLAGMGRAFAGAGIAGDDASDMFYNPAGMLLMDERQFQIGATFISPNAKFENQGSSQRLLTPVGPVTIPTGGLEDNGGDDAIVPALYYSFPRNGDFKYGISISAPFGLATEYDKNWVGRYHALRSELKTIDVNPSIAYAINDNVSIGGGISIQKAEATLSQAVFLGPTSPVDGKATVTGDDTSIGFNLGLMVGNEDARFGIGFRSKVEVEAEGDIRITTPAGTQKFGADAAIDLPETIYVSGFKQLTDRLGLMGSVRWTNWSRFEELRIKFDGPLPDAVTDESWEDTTTISLGLNFNVNDQWLVRAGISHDESPVPDVERRTPRIPDTDRDWLTFGASYKPSDRVTVDFAYAHLFTDGSKVDNTIDLVSSAPGAFTDNLTGEFTDADADLIGVQIHVKF